MQNTEDEAVLPIAEEVLRAEKRDRVGRVRVRTTTQEHREIVAQDLARDEVSVERVPVDREVDAVPAIREEGDVTIVPVLEEVLVVEKRLVLKEELHIRRRRTTEHVEEPVTIRRQHAVVDRPQD